MMISFCRVKFIRRIKFSNLVNRILITGKLATVYKVKMRR